MGWLSWFIWRIWWRCYSGFVQCCQPWSKDSALKLKHYLAFLEPCDKTCPISTIQNCCCSGTNPSTVHGTDEGLRKLLLKHLHAERGKDVQCWACILGLKTSWQVTAAKSEVPCGHLGSLLHGLEGKLEAPGQPQTSYQHQEILKYCLTDLWNSLLQGITRTLGINRSWLVP